MVGCVNEDFESKDLDWAVIVVDGNAQEVAFTSCLFWSLTWRGGVYGRGGGGGSR